MEVKRAMQRETTSTWQLITRWLVFVGLVGIAASFVIVAVTESWESVAAWATFGLSFVASFVCAVLNMAWLVRLLGNRRTLFALNVAVMVVLAGVVLAGVNYLAERRLPLSMRRIDITSGGLYGLSSQTRNLLESLDKEVQICALLSNPEIAKKYQDFAYVPQVHDLLEEYDKCSTKVKVSYVDMMRDPAAAWEFIIWMKLPKTLKEHKVDADAFKKAFGKSDIDSITGFNLLRTIDDWSGPKARIEAIAERKAGHSIEALQFGKQLSAEKLREMQKEFDANVAKETEGLQSFLKRLRDIIAEAKLDEQKQKDLLKAIKDLDIPEPESNSVIFVCGDKSKHVKPYDMVHSEYGERFDPNQQAEKTFKGEDAFTAAIKEIIEEDQMTVYFITGHGERRTDGYREDGYSDVKSALEKANYKVENLDLMREREIPDACDVLVAAAPLIPYNESEVAAIRRYLDSGGSLLALFEPLFPSFHRFERRPSPLADLLRAYNVDVRENVTVLDMGYVLELTRKGLEQKPQIQGTVQVARYPKHRIVSDMRGVPSAFRWVCFVDQAAKATSSAFDAARLLEGSKDGWGETDLAMLRRQRATKNEKTDVMAPVPIGAVAESKKKFERKIVKKDEKEAKKRPAKPIRVVAIGDADFAANSLGKVRGNIGLFVNAVSWLAGKETQIGIAPVAGKAPPLSLSSKQKKRVFYGAVVGLPALWVLFGLLMLMVRSLRSVGLTRPTLAKLGIPVGLLLILVGIAIGTMETGRAGSVSVLLLGVVVLAVALLLGKDFIRGLFRRRTLVGANTFVMAFLGLAAVGVICFVGSKRYLRFDWTRDNKHALAGPALDAVKAVDKWVNIYAMYPAAVAAQYPILSKVQDALEEFAYSSDYVELKHVPTDQDKKEAFLQALKLQPDQRTLVVFQSGDQVRHVSFEDLIVREQLPQQMMMQMRMQGMPQPPPKFRGQEAFANALARVTRDRKSTIYFTTGHKERDIADHKGPGFGELRDVLRRKGFQVRAVNLEEAGEVPEDCDVLVIAGPETPFSDEAIDVVRRYCENNGRLFVMLEPALGKNASSALAALQREPSGLAPLLTEYKINVDESILVVDAGQSVRLTSRGFERVRQARVQVRVADSGYQHHPINDKLRGLPTLFHLACEVSAEEGPPDRPRYPGAPPPQDSSPYKASKLLEASSDGWGDTSVGKKGVIAYSDSEDKKGPIPFAACVEPKAQPKMPWGPPPDEAEGAGPRIVCIGDADFASSQILKAGNNANEDFIMRCINWLAKTEGEIKITPTKLEPDRMDELKSSQKGWTLAICLGGLPIGWIAIGLLVWGFRRLQP